MSEEEYTELVDRLDRIETILNGKEVMSIEECASYIGYSIRGLYHLTHKRGIPFYKPNGKNLFFKKSEVDEWIFQNRIASDAEVSSNAATFCANN